MDTVLFHTLKHELSVSIALSSKVRKTRYRKVLILSCYKMHDDSKDKMLQGEGR